MMGPVGRLRPLQQGLSYIQSRIGSHIKTYEIPGRSAGRSYSSDARWKARQKNDVFAREARVQGLKSRAAFKLLELDSKYRIFREGQVIVDLGYAPGSWSQVAVERTKPSGNVVGIDLIPAQPPRGVSTIQGNFLSPTVQAMVKDFLATMQQNRRRKSHSEDTSAPPVARHHAPATKDRPSNDMELLDTVDSAGKPVESPSSTPGNDNFASAHHMVDVVLSDMSAPWDQTSGFGVNAVGNPYNRMINTSGIAFRDHIGSMDLCRAALGFASDTLRHGGHFICKFYQGPDDKAFETTLRQLFTKVYREKPASSRKESKEAYFVALRRLGSVTL